MILYIRMYWKENWPISPPFPDSKTAWKIALCYAWIDPLKGRNRIVIDIDSTDDPTHGAQQLSMFNGHYGHFMYNE